MKTTIAAALALLLTSAALPALAQPLEPTARKAAVEQAAKALREQYVEPSVGAATAEKITAAEAAGAYAHLTDVQAFAKQISADMAEVAHDGHLRVVTRNGPPPPGAQGGPPPRSEAGVVRADRLAGDVGYLEVVGFPPGAVFKPAIDKAMSQIADCKALIVDLRRNGGGEPEAVAYLVSFFVPGDKPVHVNDLIWRNPGTETFRTEAFWTEKTPVRFTGKPVYLLTSKQTFSGGEEFAYDLQAMKLAKLVGETTGGGANPGGITPMGGELALFLPSGKARNPITDDNWEGRGVRPDLATSSADALKAALKALGQSPAAGDIEGLSKARLFTPRTIAQTGSEAAVRRSVEEIVRGEPDYARMTPELAEATRAQAGGMRQMLSGMGPLKSVTFREVNPIGADVYDVVFEKGALRWMIVLAPDGRTALASFRPA
ncbi:S41 family peptidase [Phenylobacterium deserti]|uniref:Peptidase S41 n=1 Tax=Phenylobacterium deserti TaxID=1914756 RepID=A0A328AVP7_9CAUL|nr:S41 family peptidase [Phenylobacterium deserti]RAK57634.1 peptidase S41 [Phenylobacterium deserti]